MCPTLIGTVDRYAVSALTSIYVNIQASYSAAGSYTSLLASGSLSVSVDTLNAEVNSGSKYGSKDKVIRLGTDVLPVPVKMYTEPITRALEDLYWSKRIAADSSLTSTLALKRMLVVQALDYYFNEYGLLLKGMCIMYIQRRRNM